MSNIVRAVEMPDETRMKPVQRLLLAISLAAGLLYPFLQHRFGPVADVYLKGLAVGALALAAALTPGSGWKWLAVILGLAALGDMLLELDGGMTKGAAAFAAGHVVAIVFYLRHRRPGVTIFGQLFAAALVGFGFAMPGLLLLPEEPLLPPTVYSVLLCTMAATAWLSRFPRRWTALGALLFVISDTFLMMRMGGLTINGDAGHGRIVWYSYYLGQLLIFVGVGIGLAREAAASGKQRAVR
jgi:uncharacterized membrane protein YhhN